jgi:hypothetical protein
LRQRKDVVNELDDGDLLTDLAHKALGGLNVDCTEGIFSIDKGQWSCRHQSDRQ